MKDGYFQNLNYTLGNEDTRLEFDVLPARCSHIVSVCGSGGRVLPLLARNPARITVVDISPVQLSLLRLRVAVLTEDSVEDYLRFWGFPASDGITALSPAERKTRFSGLALTKDDRETLAPYFERAEWRSLLLEGRWEKTFRTLSKIVRRVLGAEWVDRFFAIENEVDHLRFMDSEFPALRWRLVLALLSNAAVFNVLLYRGSFPEKNIPQTYLRFYLEAFDRLFAQGPARRNYFLQLCFLGELRHAEGLPAEADPALLRAAKDGVRGTEWEFVRGDVLDTIASAREPVGFVSLSDVPSYFKPPIEQSFLAKIRPGLAKKGKVVTRNYLRVPVGLDTTGYSETTADFRAAIGRERLQMYDVHVYEKAAP